MSARARRRVVVTGIGLVTPLGVGVACNWSAILERRSGIRAITRFPTEKLRCRIGGEVADFDPAPFFSVAELGHVDPFIQYAVAASRLALDDAGLPELARAYDRNRLAVAIGVGFGGLSTLERALTPLPAGGLPPASPFTIPNVIPNLAAGQVALRHGCGGPALSPTSACAAGLDAIGQAFELIHSGRADAALCGGTEAALAPTTVRGFSALRVLSTRNDTPAAACRPFDASRDGFVIGEGAGLLLLEERDAALARGARAYAEILGFAQTCDAHHPTAPDPSGGGAIRALRLLLEDAGLRPDEVGYVNAHGTGTLLNDVTEARAIREVLAGGDRGEVARGPAISSTKPYTGHMLGAAGGAEAAFTALALYHQTIPPLLNFTRADADGASAGRFEHACDPGLDYVSGAPRPADFRVAVKQSFAFGGMNAALALARV